MAFAWNFFPDFSDFFEGGLWGKSFLGNIKYFGAQIFPVVWPVHREIDFFLFAFFGLVCV